MPSLRTEACLKRDCRSRELGARGVQGAGWGPGCSPRLAATGRRQSFRNASVSSGFQKASVWDKEHVCGGVHKNEHSFGGRTWSTEPTVSLLLSVHVSPTVPPTPNCRRPGEKDSVRGHPWPNPGFPPRRRGRYAFPWPACHIPGALSAAAAPSPGGRPLSQASPWGEGGRGGMGA